MRILISSGVDEDLIDSKELNSEDELERCEGMLEKAHLLNLNKFSNLISLIEAKAQRNKMKKKQEMMNLWPLLCFVGVVAFILIM